MTTLALSDGVPRPARRALASLDGVDVVPAPRPAMITEERVTPLHLREASIPEVRTLAAREDAASTLLLIRGVLSDDEAVALEDRGQPFVDAAGRAWVPGAPRTPRVQGASGGRIRPQTLRAVQLLADHPDETWSSPRLARRADISQATADRLLRRLLRLGLVRRHGAGRSTSTTVEDARALRRWLVANGRQSRQERLPCYVRDPATLPAELDDLRLIQSGAHGAAILGLPVMSGAPRLLLRVEATGDDLERLPSRLGGIRSPRAANVLLVADPGRLASHDARLVAGVWVAPPSRVCLDMTLEPRGDAAAEVFLDLWSDQVL